MPNPVAVLTFHHFHPLGGHLSVPPDLLETVLVQLRRRYTFIAYDRFKEHLAGGRATPPNCVLVTLDDGYLDQYVHGFPVFQRLEIPFVIFLVTGFIREQRSCRSNVEALDHRALWRDPDPAFFLNTAEIAAMYRSGGVDFGSHSASHLRCQGKSEIHLHDEFSRSHAVIRSLNLERAPYGFCWPQGRFDAVARRAIRQSPYQFAFSTRDGAWRRGDDAYTIRRIDGSSFSGDRRDYAFRLKRKLWIYSSRTFGHWYRAFKDLRESCSHPRVGT